MPPQKDFVGPACRTACPTALAFRRRVLVESWGSQADCSACRPTPCPPTPTATGAGMADVRPRGARLRGAPAAHARWAARTRRLGADCGLGQNGGGRHSQRDASHVCWDGRRGRLGAFGLSIILQGTAHRSSGILERLEGIGVHHMAGSLARRAYLGRPRPKPQEKNEGKTKNETN